MIRVLILGAGGMLGHMALRVLIAEPRYHVVAHARTRARTAALPPDARARIMIEGDLARDGAVERTIADVRPQTVVNCTGVVPRTSSSAGPDAMEAVNARLPHRLAAACSAQDVRLIHMSTDCVFSGMRGGYRESDPADATDRYARTKQAGEVGAPHLTLRTSMIGPELDAPHGLLEWFLRSPGPVPGYTHARFSGLTTLALARLLADHVLPRPDLAGIYHIAAEPTAKHDLLRAFRAAYDLRTLIVPDDRIVIDRTLDGSRFAAATGWTAPSWPKMLEAMRAFG